MFIVIVKEIYNEIKLHLRAVLNKLKKIKKTISVYYLRNWDP